MSISGILPARRSFASLIAPRERRTAITVYCAAAATIVLFALTPVTTRLAVARIDCLSLALLRIVVGAPIAALLLLVCGLRPPIKNWTDRKLLALSSIGSFVAFGLLFSFGAQHTSALHAGFGLATIPLFTGIFGMIVERRAARPAWLLGAVIALFGEALLATTRSGDLARSSSVTGDLLVLAATCCVAIGFVAGSRLTARTDSWTATYWALVVAGLIAAPVLLLEHDGSIWARLDLTGWLAIAHLAIGSNIVGFMLWFYALARGGLAQISVLQFLQPALTVAFAAMLLGEQLAGSELAAGAVILLGVVVARRSAA